MSPRAMKTLLLESLGRGEHVTDSKALQVPHGNANVSMGAISVATIDDRPHLLGRWLYDEHTAALLADARQLQGERGNFGPVAVK